MSLEETISGIQENLRQGRFRNEAAVSQGVILPMLQALDWSVFNPSLVFPQYPTEGREAVDYALCSSNGQPLVFLEAKRVGTVDDDAETQLFRYAFQRGVPLLILTDGQEWDFYVPYGQGTYKERRVYRLDLLERDLKECSYRLQRYLSNSNVLNGSAFDNARADYDDAFRQRQIDEALPSAWKRLIEEADESLVEALAKKVAKCAVTNLTQRFAPISFRTGLCLSNLPNPIVLGLSDNNRNVSPRRAQLFRKSASSCVVTTTHVPMLLG